MGPCSSLQHTERCLCRSRCWKLTSANQYLLDVCLYAAAPSAFICPLRCSSLLSCSYNTLFFVMIFIFIYIYVCSNSFSFCWICIFFIQTIVTNSSFAVSCSQCLIRWLCSEDRDFLDGRRCEAGPVLSGPAGQKRCACVCTCVCVSVCLCIRVPDV